MVRGDFGRNSLANDGLLRKRNLPPCEKRNEMKTAAENCLPERETPSQKLKTMLFSLPQKAKNPAL
jgi:hypothetical protein